MQFYYITDCGNYHNQSILPPSNKSTPSCYFFAFGSTCCYCLVTKLCPTLCNLMDYSLPGSSAVESSRQECWNALQFPPLGDLPNLGTEPTSFASPALQADSLPLSHQEGLIPHPNSVSIPSNDESILHIYSFVILRMLYK